MSRPQTYEQRLLCKAEQMLSQMAGTHEERLQLLEAAAAAKSGCDIAAYWSRFHESPAEVDRPALSKLIRCVEESGIPFPMAISSLAREPISVEAQKKIGAFYTDFRLAVLMAADCSSRLKQGSSVADFAAGTGILIAGVASVYQQKFPGDFNRWLAQNLYAFDLSPLALRGARAALLSMTCDLSALEAMSSHWKVTDSLLDAALSRLHLDIVVGNPPWGKLKLSRHEFLMQNGAQRVYGTDYADLDDQHYASSKERLRLYAKQVKETYRLLGGAEPDMYMAFLQRAVDSAVDGGHISYLVPAGLIRSKGTQVLRQYLFDHADRVEFDLLDNQANYFTIDSRFKFVLLSFDKAVRPGTQADHFYFSIPTADSRGVTPGEPIRFPIRQLRAARPDLTVPEVRSDAEKALFFKICQNGRPWGTVDGLWQADIAREVDMTNDRDCFLPAADAGAIPVVEGRMVQQHRFGAKTYLSGSGRSAKWIPCAGACRPQFYYPRDRLSPELAARTEMPRAGYCDIGGQTNERAMMSALIPPGVVCGNKVPTILFPRDSSGNLIYLWIGITNSFVFDWMIRRIISTTVNYFLLFSIPMPDLLPESPIAQGIIQRTRQLAAMGDEYYTGDAMAELRGEIDALAAAAYGLNMTEIELVLADFPILDRRQPPIRSEKKSTVTRDLMLSKCEQYLDTASRGYTDRYAQAKEAGARAYIPTEMTLLSKKEVPCMASAANDVKLVIYKKIVDGDLRKFSATSNDQPSGGGARDLRFSPAEDFLPAFAAMFPNRDGPVLHGLFSWVDLPPTEVDIHPPTPSRPSEIRIGRVHECFPAEVIPRSARDCILLLILDGGGSVWPYFTSEHSLRTDNWHPMVRDAILRGLHARRPRRITPMGYINLADGRSYTNGEQF